MVCRLNKCQVNNLPSKWLHGIASRSSIHRKALLLFLCITEVPAFVTSFPVVLNITFWYVDECGSGAWSHCLAVLLKEEGGLPWVHRWFPLLAASGCQWGFLRPSTGFNTGMHYALPGYQMLACQPHLVFTVPDSHRQPVLTGKGKPVCLSHYRSILCIQKAGQAMFPVLSQLWRFEFQVFRFALLPSQCTLVCPLVLVSSLK